MRRGVVFTLVALVVALVVGGLGTVGRDEAGRTGVWVGVAIGFLIQVVGFWLLFVFAFPGRVVLAHGLGMLIRMLALGVVALVWLPVSGLRPAPTLLAMVGVLFLTMLVEPVVLKTSTER